MSSKITVELAGGLGNQMFQYAHGRSLEEQTHWKLFLDRSSGFQRDKIYRRRFMLDKFPIRGLTSPLGDRLKFTCLRLNERTTRIRTLSSIVNESSPYEFSPTGIPEGARSIWTRGYWQSPRYFAGHEKALSQELAPPMPTDDRYVRLGERLQDETAVVVGVRLYEESPNPHVHSADGKLISPERLTQVVEAVSSIVGDPKFFVFCTVEPPWLESIDALKRATIVDHRTGLTDAVGRLWLLTQAKTHIISNSTFYWWGAWLSQSKFDCTRVWAADNFVNRDALPALWERF